MIFLIMTPICVARVPASRVHGVDEKEHSRSGPEVGHRDNCIPEMESGAIEAVCIIWKV